MINVLKGHSPTIQFNSFFNHSLKIWKYFKVIYTIKANTKGFLTIRPLKTQIKTNNQLWPQSASNIGSLYTYIAIVSESHRQDRPLVLAVCIYIINTS